MIPWKWFKNVSHYLCVVGEVQLCRITRAKGGEQRKPMPLISSLFAHFSDADLGHKIYVSNRDCCCDTFTPSEYTEEDLLIVPNHQSKWKNRWRRKRMLLIIRFFDLWHKYTSSKYCCYNTRPLPQASMLQRLIWKSTNYDHVKWLPWARRVHNT